MKRAQAAIEFLMTYGWALLIIVVAISALVYFGVLNSDRFLPERCDLPSGFNCLSFRVTETLIDLVIQNDLGEDISITSIVVHNFNGQEICSETYSDGDGDLINGRKETFTISDCDTGGSEKRFRARVYVNYDDEEGLSRSRIGEISTIVQ